MTSKTSTCSDETMSMTSTSVYAVPTIYIALAAVHHPTCTCIYYSCQSITFLSIKAPCSQGNDGVIYSHSIILFHS